MKDYQYKVYAVNGDYITSWQDVTSEPNFNQEINTAGSQLKVTLARSADNYGEGVDIDFGYNVKIYCSDLEDPGGLCIYQGYISSYEPSYQTNTVDITLLSYGGELDKFMIQEVDGTTTITYASQDPSDILKDIVDKYEAQGGVLSYDVNSIDDTSTTVSYTFNSNTTLEGIKKCLELAPSGWFWYVDNATNLIHFHEENVASDYSFGFEKDIKDAKFEKRIDDLVNTIYFTGGDTGGGVILYKKYENTDSVTAYGIRAMKYVDQRVTVAGTAQIIANAILDKRSVPELRATIEVIDSNGSDYIGFDIESIKMGDTISVRNATSQIGTSLWDTSLWDDGYWDFNIQNIDSLQMQIQKISYSPDMAVIFASTLATDVNKRIEDINRNLEASQTLNNPTIPT